MFEVAEKITDGSDFTSVILDFDLYGTTFLTQKLFDNAGKMFR